MGYLAQLVWLVIESPCDHDGMVLEPSVRSLAVAMQRLMREAHGAR